MINVENNIFIQETEQKPNHYATLVLLFTLFGMLGCWILNEIGILRANDTVMRIGMGATIVATLLPLVLIKLREKVADPKMKFFIMGIGIIYTLLLNTLLAFHSTIMLLFPLFLAMMYRSKALGRLATLGAFICTTAAPIISYMLGIWDVELFEELILIATGQTVNVHSIIAEPNWVDVGKILLYLVVPRYIMVGSFSILMFRVIQLGVDHTENQIALSNIRLRDNLTQLYTQSYFKEVLISKENKGPVGVLFFDVNGLKKTNDTYGHEYGDMLLEQSARSLRALCTDTIHGFRVGGDEFLLLIEGADGDAVETMKAKWQTTMDEINQENHYKLDGLFCSMAVGSAAGDFSDLDTVVKHADTSMYRNKATVKKDGHHDYYGKLIM